MIRRSATLVVALLLGLLGIASAAAPAPLRIGAVFPLSGPLAASAAEERHGIQIAADLVNADGGVQGRRITLEGRDLSRPEDAQPVVDSLRGAGVSVVIGAYSSGLSIPVSAAASAAGMVYWETGAVADRVTGRGLASVFRPGASGGNLGANSATFTAAELAPRLGLTAATTRVVIVHETDDYGQSVAAGALGSAHERGLDVVGSIGYDAYAPHFDDVLARVAALQPDVIVLASYIADGVAFRRAMLRNHVHAGALIGSTMAVCGPEFGALLGPDAVGVFASDRPGPGLRSSTLRATARADFDRFAGRWRAEAGGDPTEEAIAGFSAAWALFHHVLPRAASLDTGGVSAAATATVLAPGTLPNGAGLHFSEDPATRGQNLDAAAVIWQWQAVRHSVVVWPPSYATGRPTLVPLPA